MPRSTTTVWRWVIVSGVLALAAAPVVPLLGAAVAGPTTEPLWTEIFVAAVAGSLRLGAAVALICLIVGFPLGLLAALYRFPARTPLLLVQALPLLVPSFLLAKGWEFVGHQWFPRALSPGSFPASAAVMGLQAVPLVLFATWAACRNLTASQIDAARLHGGEQTVLKRSAGACAPVAVVTAVLAGILSLTDPGATSVFDYRSAAEEIRTSFAARGDVVLAGRQCLLMAAVALFSALPFLLVGMRRLAAAVLARQMRPALPYPHPALGRIAMAGLIAVSTVGFWAPTLGMCLPTIRDPMLGRAARQVAATAGPSLVYTVGAGVVAVLLATILALSAARDLKLRSVALGVLLMLLALPPALGAIGVAHLAAKTPPALDWITRSQLTVALVLGLRLLPVAAVAMMRAVGSLSPSWTDAAVVHGISRPRLLLRVIIPLLTPALLVSAVLVVVLASADVTTTHLLHPGRQSLALTIFTVMANSPEGLVASLCLLYLFGVVLLMAVASQLSRWLRRRTS